MGGFRVLDIEPPELALETKGFMLGLDRCLQRRAFRRQRPPQLEGDLGQAGVGLGYRFDQLLDDAVYVALAALSDGVWLTADARAARRVAAPIWCACSDH